MILAHVCVSIFAILLSTFQFDIRKEVKTDEAVIVVTACVLWEITIAVLFLTGIFLLLVKMRKTYSFYLLRADKAGELVRLPIPKYCELGDTIPYGVDGSLRYLYVGQGYFLLSHKREDKKVTTSLTPFRHPFIAGGRRLVN